MIHYQNARIEYAIVHTIGHAALGLPLKLSTQPLLLVPEVHDMLLAYMVQNFKTPEFFQFTFSSGEVVLNPVYNFVANIFDNTDSVYEESIRICRLLHDCSQNPSIIPGEVIIAYITDILVEDQLVDAVGIFKVEGKVNFLTIESSLADIEILHHQGFNIDRLDKGCLIFNTHRDTGFKILNIDHINRNKEAQYWRDQFLNISSIQNDYNQTKEYIYLTKNFIKDNLAISDVPDTIQHAGIIKRCADYLTQNDRFEVDTFVSNVIKEPELIPAFQQYKAEYTALKQSELFDTFEISDIAVQKHKKVFKSVIKLDKNFHIYIHGDRSKINKGVDSEGKKYYMIYYDEES